MIVFDPKDERFKTPFGSVRQEEEIAMDIHVSGRLGAFKVSLLLYKDGEFEPEIYPMRFKGHEGLMEVYSLKFSVEEEGLYWYRFGFSSLEGERNIGRGQGQKAFLDSDLCWQLTVYEKGFETPEWIKGGIMYQIFPDRFFRSSNYDPVIREDSYLREDWGGIPAYIRPEDGSVPNNDFFGGNLRGIIEKLDHLKSLNVNCIYLNPIFEAASNHKYDTGDYEKIDPVFGDEDIFKELCREAEKKGIKVILDGVFSHTGADSRYFNKNGRYPDEGAYQSKESKYYSWYDFGKWPESYRGWWGIDTLPEVNEEEPSYLEYITGKNGILSKWISAGAAGYRLDVADELPDVFLDKLRERVKDTDPEAFIIGEVWEDASNKISYGRRRRYLLGKQLDSVMNYVFREGIINFVKYGDSSGLAERVESVVRNYPPQVLNCLMNILGTHDTARALTEIGSIEKLKCAALIQYFLPGVPCIYYGDETGMTGGGDPYCRGCYPWGSENEDLIEFYRTLGKIRTENKDVLKDGKYFTNYVNQDIICYKRTNLSGSIFVIVKVSEGCAVLSPEDMGIDFSEGRKIVDMIDGHVIDGDIILNGIAGKVFRSEVRDNDEK
ncbi:MAG: glycoside hydrolase family 13 protein [Firmicutes bacterium]|nr:glycoside hydrolase family 13 protein [Bacillota bacterium]